MTVRSSNEGNEGKSLSEPASPNVKLYVVVACIAALVLVAIVQVVFLSRIWPPLVSFDAAVNSLFRRAALYSK